jgi:hypothetical protein
MKSTIALAVALSLQCVGAAPTQAGNFALGEVENPQYRQMEASSALIRAHAKYGSQLPPGMKKAIQINPELHEKFKMYLALAGDASTVPAYNTPWYDSQYVVPVQIGTPPQTVYLNLDTGSSDLWTFSTDTYPPQVQGQVLYKPASSNTSRRLNGESWNIRYGDGAGASGIVYRDRVALGKTSFDDQAVQAAIQVSSDISSDAFASGILGLAQTAANTVRPTKQKTFIDNMQATLAKPLFTSNLQKGQVGNYNFGYVNASEYTGPLKYTPIDTRNPLWKVSLTGYQVGSTGNYTTRTWSGIVDTGTTLLLVPQDMVEAYYALVRGAGYDDYQGMVVMPCQTVLPDFQFGIDTFRGHVPGHYMNYGLLNETHCFGGVQSSEGIPFAVIGDILIKAQFVVFDLGGKQVGFADKPTVPPS